MSAAAVRIYFPSPSGFLGIGETGKATLLVVASGGVDDMVAVRIRICGNALLRTRCLDPCKSGFVTERKDGSIGLEIIGSLESHEGSYVKSVRRCSERD